MLIHGPADVSLKRIIANCAKFSPHARFTTDIAPALYRAAVEHGIDPAVMIGQAGNETGWGHFKGTATRPALVLPEFHNPCGLKKYGQHEESRDAHAQFPDWLTGARAHAEHLDAYCQVLPPYGEFRYDPRWSYVYGKRPAITHVEQLGGAWAPKPEYGQLIAHIAAKLKAGIGMIAYLDGWEWVQNPRSAGSTYDPEGFGYPWRIMLHTVESRGMGNPAAHPYPPHLWYDSITRKKVQTVRLDRAAFALYQPGYGSEYTNRSRCFQIELVGYAEEAGSWSDQQLRNIAEDVIVPLVRAIRDDGGSININNIARIGSIPMSATDYAPQRLSESEWRWFNGLCSHRNAPYNDHWDTGLLNLHRIVEHANAILGGAPSVPVPPPITYYWKTRTTGRMDSMKPELRKHYDGRTDVFDWDFGDGNRRPAVAYDFPVLPVGSIVAVHGKRPDLDQETHDRWCQLVNREAIYPAAAFWWGTSATAGPVKSALMHSVVVPAALEGRIDVVAVLPTVVAESLVAM